MNVSDITLSAYFAVGGVKRVHNVCEMGYQREYICSRS